MKTEIKTKLKNRNKNRNKKLQEKQNRNKNRKIKKQCKIGKNRNKNRKSQIKTEKKIKRLVIILWVFWKLRLFFFGYLFRLVLSPMSAETTLGAELFRTVGTFVWLESRMY